MSQDCRQAGLAHTTGKDTFAKGSVTMICRVKRNSTSKPSWCTRRLLQRYFATIQTAKKNKDDIHYVSFIVAVNQLRIKLHSASARASWTWRAPFRVGNNSHHAAPYAQCHRCNAISCHSRKDRTLLRKAIMRFPSLDSFEEPSSLERQASPECSDSNFRLWLAA
jgi:hypothetical protein